MSSAESTPVSVQTYRERLVDLRRLDFAYVRRHLPVDLPSAAVAAPLRFLCGNLIYFNDSRVFDLSGASLTSMFRDDYRKKSGLSFHLGCHPKDKN